jgi:hypothetical protein
VPSDPNASAPGGELGPDGGSQPGLGSPNKPPKPPKRPGTGSACPDDPNGRNPENGVPDFANTLGGLVNRAKNLEAAYKATGEIPSAETLDQLYGMAQEFGVKIRFDSGHPNTAWDIPHLNVGNPGWHVPIPPGYSPPMP